MSNTEELLKTAKNLVKKIEQRVETEKELEIMENNILASEGNEELKKIIELRRKLK
jgi:hypothetical protein